MPATTPDVKIPHNLEAERAILGSILLDNEALPTTLEIINKDDFYSEAHRLTFFNMLALAERNQAIDLVTLCEELRKHGLIDKAGGDAYLAELTDNVPIGNSAGVAEYARIVKEKAVMRALINASNSLISRAMDGTASAEDLIESVNAQIQGLRMRDVKAKSESGRIEVIGKAEVESGKKNRPKKPENIYPFIPKDAWHPAAELYRRAHENCTEGSDNWHFISFYTAVGSLLGRSLGTRMGQMIYGNLYAVLVGQIGGDGKDTCADFATDFMRMIDNHFYIPESIDSKPGFIKEWSEFNIREQLVNNHRVLLRLPEIRTYLDTAAQSGTKSVTPMLLTHYSARPSLDNSSIATNAHIQNPHFSVLACGAKRFIAQIPEPDLINGLGRRICFVPGDPKGPNPEPAAPDMEILIPLAGSVKETLEFYQSRKDGFHLKLSPESKKLWKDWYKVYWKRKRGDDLLAALNNGDRVTCRKIALINAGLDREEDFIQTKQLEPAMAFIEYLYECRYPVFSEHGANPYVEIEKKIMDKVPEYPNRVLKRWLQRYLRSIDSKTFNDRIRYLTMEDGPLVRHQEGKKIWLSRAEQ